MSIDIQEPQQQTAASLVAGILGDLQVLIEQQIQLARKELEEGVRRRLIAVRILVVGGALCFLGAVLGSFAVSHLVFWLASTSVDTTARIPLWACHAIVGGTAIITGVVLMRLGQSKFNLASSPSSTSIITQE